jgi:quercetin dioxygenase-like cupin family protein
VSKGSFVLASDTGPEALDWGTRRWVSRPSLTEADDVLVVEVTLEPGAGHTFHRHPRQEEVVFVMQGEIEQYIETERRILHAGDAAFVKRGVVHASFNCGQTVARLLAIVAPCKGIGDDGYELIEVADQAPWNMLRRHVPGQN